MREPELPEPLDGEGVRSRAWQAYQLKMAGLDLPEIALRLNYPTGAAVAKAINDEIRREARSLKTESRTELLDLELDRLNYMLSKIWQQIEYGDLNSIRTGMAIIAQRTKLLGLDLPDASTQQQTVLVVSGSEADYIKALQAAS
jgi:hypothetical protein